MANITDEKALEGMVQVTCLAVCGYIGTTFGWKIVAGPWDHQSHKQMEGAFQRLPAGSRDIIKREAEQGGYKASWASNLLPFDWMTKRQKEGRLQSIVAIAMRSIADEDWLKR